MSNCKRCDGSGLHALYGTCPDCAGTGAAGPAQRLEERIAALEAALAGLQARAREVELRVLPIGPARVQIPPLTEEQIAQVRAALEAAARAREGGE